MTSTGQQNAANTRHNLIAVFKLLRFGLQLFESFHSDKKFPVSEKTRISGKKTFLDIFKQNFLETTRKLLFNFFLEF